MRFKDFLLYEGTGFSINELKTWVPSWRNRYFYDLRKKEGHTGSFLQFIDWNEKQNYIRLIYHIIPTYNKKVKIVSSTKTGNVYKSDHYECILELEDVNQIIGDKKYFLSLKPKEQEKTLRNFINNTTIKVQSNDMSFTFQGAWENLSNALKSVYSFPIGIPRGKQIWSIRHKGEKNALYITKHLIEVIGTVPFLISKICKMIREEDYIPSKTKKKKITTKKIYKPKEPPSNLSVDLSTIPKIPSPKNINLHQEIAARLKPFFNLVKNKTDWKKPIDKTLKADEKTIQGISEAIEYFTGSIPNIKKIGKNLYRIQAVGYYNSMGTLGMKK